MALTDYHGYFEDSVRWRLTRDAQQRETEELHDHLRRVRAASPNARRANAKSLPRPRPTLQPPCVLTPSSATQRSTAMANTLASVSIPFERFSQSMADEPVR